MRSNRIHSVMVAGLFVVSASLGAAPGQKMEVRENTKLTWVDMDVPGFAPGMKMAALNGDPSVADQLYTLRLKFPDGYRFPAHYHPKAENLTVLSGTFLLEMGPKETGAFTKYVPGDYLFIPPTMPHSGGATGETVIQLHGVGPFDIMLVKPVK